MNKERLQHLIAILEKVPPEQLRMSNWYSTPSKCGTVACAIGHAALDPEFNRQGLHLNSMHCPVLAENAVEFTSWSAVEKFFGLALDDAFDIFSYAAYQRQATPQDVINRIQRCIDEVHQ